MSNVTRCLLCDGIPPVSYTREEVEEEFREAQRQHLTWSGTMPLHIYHLLYVDHGDNGGMHIFETNPLHTPQTRAERLASKRESERRRALRRAKPPRMCAMCACVLVAKVGKPAKYCPACRAGCKLHRAPPERADVGCLDFLPSSIGCIAVCE